MPELFAKLNLIQYGKSCANYLIIKRYKLKKVLLHLDKTVCFTALTFEGISRRSSK
jgi:hypothetical protein